jgi:hypothetical protein
MLESKNSLVNRFFLALRALCTGGTPVSRIAEMRLAMRRSPLLALHVAGFSLALHLLLVCALADSTATKPVDPEEARAQKLIDQLDDPDPQIRLHATLQLNSLGPGALNAVQAALKSDDLSPDSRLRLEAALKYLRPRSSAQKVREARAMWKSETFHRAFANGGHAKPQFDADAHRAIDLYLALGRDPAHGPPEQRAAALAAFEKVQSAGCDDPLIAALHRLADGKPLRSSRQRPPQGDEAILFNCCQGNYPASVKCHVWATFMAWQNNVFNEDMQLLIDLTKASISESPLMPLEIDERLELLGAGVNDVIEEALWKKFIAEYEQAAPQAPGPLLLQARAAEVSAMVFRDELTQQNHYDNDAAMKYYEMLGDASKIAEQAWQRDPSDGRAAKFILQILNIQVEHDVQMQQMETWFDRAIAADSDDREPYDLKFRYLLWGNRFPREAVLEFGHQCLRSQNWRGGIPLLVVTAHERLADVSGDRQMYFQQPSVWSDVREAYEGDLINFPDDLQRRCEFAKYACLCGQWETADHEFARIGDHPVLSVFGSESSFKYLRNKAHRLASEH